MTMASTSRGGKRAKKLKGKGCVDKFEEDKPGMDRISILPDELLIKILSDLPTKTAVATSLLSKRWRYLFMEARSLDLDYSLLFKDSESDQNSRKKSAAFTKFVNRMLRCWNLSSLSRFRLDCGYGYCNSGLNCSKVSAWLDTVLSHPVKELDVCIKAQLDDFTLPRSFFNHNTLSTIKLEAHFGLDIPGSFSLPNLKTLHLCNVWFSDSVVVSRLFSGCPLLKEFITEGHEWRDVSDLFITSTSLRKLVLDFSQGIPSIGTKSQVTINAPLLEYFEYVGNLACGYSLRSSKDLVEACIFIAAFPDEFEIEPENELTSMSGSAFELFEQISCVKHLILTDQYLEAVIHASRELPSLLNLTNLELGCKEFRRWEISLPLLLRSAPNLEELCFPEGLAYVICEAGNAVDELPDVPACLESRLRVIKINCDGRFSPNLSIVGYLLKLAKVLQQLIINSPLPAVGERKLPRKGELVRLPRASEACVITCNTI